MDNQSERILAGWLIDGCGGPIRKNVILHIENGLIQSVESIQQDNNPYTQFLNFKKYTILPCLIDAHVHLAWSGTVQPEIRNQQIDSVYHLAKKSILKHLYQHLKYGITAIRDGGDKNAHAPRFKDTFTAIEKIPVQMNVAGKAWYKPGRYGKLIGEPIENGTDLLKRLFKTKYRINHVKLVNSGLNSLIKFGAQTLPQFKLSELRKIVKISDSLGFSTMVHANGKDPVHQSIMANVGSIEHGFFMGKDNLKKMADKEIAWVPTAGTMQAYARHLKKGCLKAEVAQRTLDAQLDQIRMAKELGVFIVLGTDSGSLGVEHGKAVLQEIKLFITAGYSISEAIQCATANGSRLLNMTETGTITSGKRADFLVVSGNPSVFPGALNSIRHMYLKGSLFSLPDFDELKN